MTSHQGHLLIASHRLEDGNFARSVTLLVQHDDKGALGLVLDRPAAMTIREAWEQLGRGECRFDQPIFHGGPCPGPLMVIHGHSEASANEFLEGVHFTADSDHIGWLMENGEQPLRFFVGYAGWAAGQLEGELEAGAWLVAPASREIAFMDPERLWAKLTQEQFSAVGLGALNPETLPRDPSVN